MTVQQEQPMPDIACVVSSQDSLGECVLWCPRTRKVWWLDILKPCLQSFDPVSGAHTVYPLPGPNCGCAALRASGGFVLALDNGLHAFDPATGRLTFLFHPEPEPATNRYNDGRCDRSGRFWLGTMDCAIRSPSGSVYRLGPDRSVLKVLDGISVPNSTAFSPDDRTMYFADTPRHVIWAFDLDIEAGAIANRRVFADLTARKGLPDGSCVDAEGFLWNAEFAGARLVRYAPDGRVDRTVAVPVRSPTCCAFGGDDLGTLYVTSSTHEHSAVDRSAEPMSGGLLALDVGVRGLPEAMYAG
jgi:sugar lactone lactonase YvrE